MDLRSILIICLTVLFLAAVGLSVYFYTELEKKPAPIPIPEIADEPALDSGDSDNSEKIELYFITPDCSQFVVDTRLILRPQTISERIRRALEELISNKKTPDNLIDPIPEGVKLQSVYWNDLDGRVYVSFSKELIDNAPGHALGEWATIYCIVNTVAAQSATVKEVQILIDGEAIHSPSANWDWSLPFKPDYTFVRYQPAALGE